MKISVVIPSYNRADLLPETLGSVLAQTRPADEIVVVDDGSTDNTRDLVAGFGAVVRYVYQDNAWLSAARNTGARHATGDALCFLDSDDRLLPEALEALERALDADPAALAYCRTQIIAENGAVTEPWTRGAEYAGAVWERLLESNFIRSAGSVLIRRSALERAGPWDEALRGSEDWDMWLRVAEFAPFAVVRKPLFQYRVHSQTLSTNLYRTHLASLTVYEKQIRRLENDPARRALAERARDTYRHHAAFDETGQPVLQRRHRLLRALLERTGIATLYRRTPFGLRRGLRVLMGIDRRA